MKDGLVRKPAVAGRFYPGDSDALAKDINRYIDQAQPPVSPDRVIGLIAPHAGYEYSGGTAAYGYKLIAGKPYDRVVVFALSHQVDFMGASVFDGSGYATPLGEVPIDRDVVRSIRKTSPIVTFSPMAHQMEHSLEVQVPFLQSVLGEFLLVPILFRDQDIATCQKVVDALLKALPEEGATSTLVVGSTDLYHGASLQECQRQDHLLAETVKEFNEEKFEERFRRGEIMACGASSIISTMLLSRALGARKFDILHLTNSAEITGQMSGYIVGYMSAVLY